MFFLWFNNNCLFVYYITHTRMITIISTWGKLILKTPLTALLVTSCVLKSPVKSGSSFMTQDCGHWLRGTALLVHRSSQTHVCIFIPCTPHKNTPQQHLRYSTHEAALQRTVPRSRLSTVHTTAPAQHDTLTGRQRKKRNCIQQTWCIMPVGERTWA